MQKLIDRWCCNSSRKCLFSASIELHWSKILYSSQTYYTGHTDILFYEKMQGRLQIFGTMHKKMQISLKWLKYRLKILKSSFIYYFYIVPVVPKLKKLKKSPYDQNNRNWMSHWHHANYHIFCNFHWKFGTQPLKHFISIST